MWFCGGQHESYSALLASFLTSSYEHANRLIHDCRHVPPDDKSAVKTTVEA